MTTIYVPFDSHPWDSYTYILDALERTRPVGCLADVWSDWVMDEDSYETFEGAAVDYFAPRWEVVKVTLEEFTEAFQDYQRKARYLTPREKEGMV